nr:hypothetical protein Iba_chr01dCG11650 [Ipomoea batatas]GME11841.1 hypothetical protein Iba_scaffold12680CG0010 [Ipomoea batatas]
MIVTAPAAVGGVEAGVMDGRWRADELGGSELICGGRWSSIHIFVRASGRSWWRSQQRLRVPLAMATLAGSGRRWSSAAVTSAVVAAAVIAVVADGEVNDDVCFFFFRPAVVAAAADGEVGGDRKR